MQNLNVLLGGSETAWRDFVLEYAPLLLAVAQKTLHHYRVSDPDLADDAVQEAFLRLVREDYRGLRLYDPQRSQLRTFLAVIVRNITIDLLRKRRNTEAVSPERLEQVAAPVEVQREELQKIPAGVLSTRQSRVLHLLVNEELSVSEVAEQMGVQPHTIRSMKHKAIQRLRRYFHNQPRTGEGVAP